MLYEFEQSKLEPNPLLTSCSRIQVQALSFTIIELPSLLNSASTNYFGLSWVFREEENNFFNSKFAMSSNLSWVFFIRIVLRIENWVFLLKFATPAPGRLRKPHYQRDRFQGIDRLANSLHRWSEKHGSWQCVCTGQGNFSISLQGRSLGGKSWK